MSNSSLGKDWVPIIGVILINVERLIKPMFNWQLEFVRPSFPRFACTHCTATNGFTIRPFQCDVFKVTYILGLSFGNHFWISVSGLG